MAGLRDYAEQIRHLDDESLMTEFNEMQIVGYYGKASAAWSEMARRGLVAKNPRTGRQKSQGGGQRARKSASPMMHRQALPWQVPGSQWAPFVGPREDDYYTIWARPLTVPFWHHPLKQGSKKVSEEWIIKVFRGREEWGDEVWRLAGLSRGMVDDWVRALGAQYRAQRKAVVVDLNPDELYTMRPHQSSGWSPGAQRYAGPQTRIGEG